MAKLIILSSIVVDEEVLSPGYVLEVSEKRAKELEKSVADWGIPVFERFVEVKDEEKHQDVDLEKLEEEQKEGEE